MTRTFLRPGSIEIYASAEGNGHRPQVEHYRLQGLDLRVTPYDYWWLQKARADAALRRLDGTPTIAAGYWKYPFEVTPLGTPVAMLRREGHDMLAAPCGYCGVNIARCACGSGKEG